MECHWDEPRREKEHSLLCSKSGFLGDNWTIKHYCSIKREETAFDLKSEVRSCSLGMSSKNNVCQQGSMFLRSG